MPQRAGALLNFTGTNFEELFARERRNGKPRRNPACRGCFADKTAAMQKNHISPPLSKPCKFPHCPRRRQQISAASPFFSLIYYTVLDFKMQPGFAIFSHFFLRMVSLFEIYRQIKKSDGRISSDRMEKSDVIPGDVSRFGKVRNSAGAPVAKCRLSGGDARGGG